MLYIDHLTNDPQQQANLTGIPGLNITLTLRFMPRVQRWIMGLQYGLVSIQGIAVVSSPNFLRQYRNEIPFGMACLNVNNVDPYTVQDFANQTSNLYLMDAADVAAIEAELFT